jgi:hypothetical protein
VYTDESYIHEHYHRNEDSLFDPDDDEDVICQKEKHKGLRYCFCAAIQGPNPQVAEATEEAEDLLDWFLERSAGPSAPKRRGTILETITKFSMETTTSVTQITVFFIS